MSGGFALTVDDELDLALREAWTVEPVHLLVMANLERLRRWEPWAARQPDTAAEASYVAHGMRQFAEGAAVPTVIRRDGEIVGCLGARLPGDGVADIGYWLDVAAEGAGIVTRCTRRMIEHLVVDRGIVRVEVRSAVANARSRAVAERLGFRHEGVSRSAMSLNGERVDQAVYGLLATEWVP